MDPFPDKHACRHTGKRQNFCVQFQGSQLIPPLTTSSVNYRPGKPRWRARYQEVHRHLLLPQKGLASAQRLDTLLNRSGASSHTGHHSFILYVGRMQIRSQGPHTPLPSVTGLFSLPYLGTVQSGLAIFN